MVVANKHVMGGRFVFERTAPGNPHRIWKGAVLEDCDVTVRCGKRELLIGDSHWIRCSLRLTRVWSNEDWGCVSFDHCSFFGRYVGNQFGAFSKSRGHGGVIACDFSKAKLHACDLINCDLDSQILPLWPCFAIRDSVKRTGRMAKLKWPKDLAVWANSSLWKYSDGPRDEVVAVIDDAQRLLKEYRCPISESEFRRLLERLGDDVIIR